MARSGLPWPDVALIAFRRDLSALRRLCLPGLRRRLAFGHDASAIITMVERVTRATFLGHVPGPRHDAASVRDVDGAAPARHELVPAWRQPAPPSPAAPSQRDLGQLLGRSLRRPAPALALAGLIQHTEWDASHPRVDFE